MDYLKSFAEQTGMDMAVDKFNEFAAEKVKTKDPYTQTLPDGKKKKLKLRENATKEEQKEWKWIRKRAWLDDKCFMGCYPVDCGCGLGPLVVAIPVIGPLLMYAVHARLVTRASLHFDIDNKTMAKLQANILFDLLITFPPVIGSFLAWMNGCSTRNAAIIHTRITRLLIEREQKETGSFQSEAHTDSPFSDSQRHNTNTYAKSDSKNSRPNNTYAGSIPHQQKQQQQQQQQQQQPQRQQQSTRNLPPDTRNNHQNYNQNKPLPHNLPPPPNIPNRDYNGNLRAPPEAHQIRQVSNRDDSYRSVI